MSIKGTLITVTLAYDGGRDVTVYVPPESPQAVVFVGDGQLISRWGGLLEAGDLPPTMIVGVHRPADETVRLHEYSPGFDPERFAAHERFFVEDVPFFLENAARWAHALRAAGAEVVMQERPGSHGDPFWQEEFPLMVAWAFGQ